MKTVGIEELLTWAFTQELWKVGAGGGVSSVSASSWSLVQGFGELCALIDRTPNHFGVVPGFEEGEPHEDALAAGHAVNRLSRLGLVMPAVGWQVFPEFDDVNGAIASEVERVLMAWRAKGAAAAGAHLVALTTRCAILGTGPDWYADEPRVAPLMKWGNAMWFQKRKRKDSLGKTIEIEVDGFDKRTRRPRPGAYRKFRVTEPLTGSVLGRLDWWLWRQALEALHDELSGSLRSHRLSGFSHIAAPWIPASDTS